MTEPIVIASKTFEVTTAFSKAVMSHTEVLSKFRLSPIAAEYLGKLVVGKHIKAGKTVIKRIT